MQNRPKSIQKISIHAPHEGERLKRHLLVSPPSYFNPRSPRGGATRYSNPSNIIKRFQSTLPTRGSDVPIINIGLKAWKFQSTLPTRGSDFAGIGSTNYVALNFNPRSPRGGATPSCKHCESNLSISIHAPHEGERRLRGANPTRARGISIHAPHEGERH